MVFSGFFCSISSQKLHGPCFTSVCSVGKTILFRTLIFVSTRFPFQLFAILFSSADAIANFLLISGVVFPFACILAPRYLKLLTLSISSLSIFITAYSLHLSVLMILVFLTFRNNHFCSLCSFTDFIRFSSPVVVVARRAVPSAYHRVLC